MPTKYYFRDDLKPFVLNRSKADPQIIGTELARIKKIYGNDDYHNTVWRQAAHPNNPLHQHFEWNERKAAESNWRATSRELIGCIEITSSRQRERGPYMVSITSPSDGRKYYETVEVLDDRHLQLQLWEDAKNELTMFLRRFARLRKLCKAAARGGKIIDAEISKLRASIAAGP